MTGSGAPIARAAALILSLLLSPATARGEDVAAKADAPDICALIGVSAAGVGLPQAYFARLIWKESRFDVKAISPAGAQGVAQFMPATAKRRGLADPFDPVQAIPASAKFLAELRAQFGSLGLAAAAYNAGEDRVSKWLAGRRGLPAETRDYVFSITGKSAEWHKETRQEAETKPLHAEKPFIEACREMPVIATRANPRPPWGVVVAGGRNRRTAIAAFNRARRQAPALIDPGRMVVLKKSRRSAGPVYTARLGYPSRNAARKSCLRIRRAGLTCYLRRN